MRTVSLGIAVLVVLSVIAIVFGPQLANGPATIQVLPNETYQTITGWEVTPRLWEMNKAEDRFDSTWQPYKQEILDRTVNELGINRIRLEFRSGYENPVDYWTQFEKGQIRYTDLKQHLYEAINDNDNPDIADTSGFQFSNLDFQVEQVLVPLRTLVEANGEKLYINLCFVDFNSIDGNLEHALKPDEYAELVSAVFLRLKARYAVVPDSLEIILEPDNTNHWRGRQIGAAILTAVERLQRSGFSPRVIAPSTSRAQSASEYFDEMIQVPGVDKLLSTFAYHRYDLTLGRSITEIRKRADQYRLQTAMLEHLTGNAEELHTDLKEGNVSAWQMWGLATKSNDPGGVDESYYYEVNFSDPARPRVRMTARARELANYFKFIRNGAVRIGARSDRPSKDPVAFRNPDGTQVVVVRATGGGNISLQGLAPGDYGVSYTTGSEQVNSSEPIRVEPGQALTTAIPAKGVITIYQLKKRAVIDRTHGPKSWL